MNINGIFNLAELSQASYSDLSVGLKNNTGNENALRDLSGASMPQTQAEQFAACYPTIITQYDDPDTGFDARCFKIPMAN